MQDEDKGLSESPFQPTLKAKLSLDITPLVDIVFLLVAFFLLSTTLGKEQSLNIDLPQASKSKAPVQKDAVISIDAKGRIFLNNRELVGKDYQKELVKELSDLQKKGLKQVVIRGDKNSPYEKIIEVMDLLSNNGIKNFALSVDRK